MKFFGQRAESAVCVRKRLQQRGSRVHANRDDYFPVSRLVRMLAAGVATIEYRPPRSLSVTQARSV